MAPSAARFPGARLPDRRSRIRAARMRTVLPERGAFLLGCLDMDTVLLSGARFFLLCGALRGDDLNMIDFGLYWQIGQLYADYAAALDAGMGQVARLLVEDCVYKVVPRENHERGFPLATMSFESRGMPKDRVCGATDTIFHDPYYQRHVVGAPRVLSVDAGRIASRAMPCSAPPNQLTTVCNVGRYEDVIRRTPDGLKFESRLCIFDSELIPNSLIYPI